MYKKRVLVSFDGKCPMNCKHCYTYELDRGQKEERTGDQIIQELENKEFDVIYISQSNENFYDEQMGIELCKKLYDKYKKDMLIITRKYLSDNTISQLALLNSNMMRNNNHLYFAVSVYADESYTVSENVEVCPHPKLRLNNLERVHQYNIKTILLLRPIFPNHIIPTIECLNLIENSKTYIDAVVSSGLIVTKEILEKLKLGENGVKYLENGNSEYLDNMNQDLLRYVDVEKELKVIQRFCELIGIAFFRHSMPALNNILNNQ